AAGTLNKLTNSAFTLNYTAGGPTARVTTEADITSDTTDPRPEGNASTTSVDVLAPGGTPPTCSLACPLNRVVAANTNQGGMDGAIVDFIGDIESIGECGAVTASPASGSFFAVGQHTVTV